MTSCGFDGSVAGTRSSSSSVTMRRLIKALFALIVAGAVVVLVTGVVIWFTDGSESESDVHQGAVVTNGYECAGVGKSILDKGGNAVEAAIAALFCEGIAMPQSMGLGGGFLAVVYNKTEGRAYSLNARETAPGAATEDMFHQNETLAQRGGLAVGVPGELLGYWELYKQFGKNLEWADLIQPTIDLCKKGIYLTEFLAGVLKSRETLLSNDPVLRDIFIDPSTKKTWVEGQRVKRPRLAKTLETIAKEGGETLNGGSLTKAFVKDLNDHGAIITEDDMKNYKPISEAPVVFNLDGGTTMYSSPLPGSGLVLGYILNILSGFIDVNHPESVTVNQRIIESFKWGYARRTELGDPNFVNLTEIVAKLQSKEFAHETRDKINDTHTSSDPKFYGVNVTILEDHGTAHICIVDKEGNAVAVTSTINFLFGAGFASDSTGIILNDEMDDFSIPGVDNGFEVPPSPTNYVRPGKRPLSSMCPTILVNKDKEVLMVIGGAGGTKITTGVALTIIRHLWFGMDLKAAVDEKRMHHQLLPMEIQFEPAYETEAPELVKGLAALGHKYNSSSVDGFAAVTAISKYKRYLTRTLQSATAAFDRRRKGSIAYA